MAGNFSFGDYFKEDAIGRAWSWSPGRRTTAATGSTPSASGSPSTDDDEAIELWQKVAGLPTERIQRRGWQDNYWSMGVPGPGGPCSEIYYDRGPEYGREGGPVVDEDRYLEIWNLVFMQDGAGRVSRPGRALPDPRVRCPRRTSTPAWASSGSRSCCRVCDNVYETDLVRPVITKAEELSGRKYGPTRSTTCASGVIADHARSSVMLVGDGVTPGNEARGYVLRRLLRRIVRSAACSAYRAGAAASSPRSSATRWARPTRSCQDFARIQQVVRAEEETFLRTLDAGSRIFEVPPPR